MNIADSIKNRVSQATSQTSQSSSSSGGRGIVGRWGKGKQGEARITARHVIKGLNEEGWFLNQIESMTRLSEMMPSLIRKFQVYSSPEYQKVAAQKAQRGLISQSMAASKLRQSVARSSGAGPAVLEAIGQGTMDEAIWRGFDVETQYNDPATRLALILQVLQQAGGLQGMSADLMGSILGGGIGQMSATTPPQSGNVLAQALGMVAGMSGFDVSRLFRSPSGGMSGTESLPPVNLGPSAVVRGSVHRK